LNLALFAAIVGKGWDWFGTFRLFLGNAYLLNVPVYWLLAAGIYALRIAQQARERERRALKLEAQLSEARLLALRAQLEPHFLFNALNTIAVLMREDVDAADRVLALLSRLLRRVLDAASAPEVQLRQEVEFLEAYLAIEQARFPHRLSFHVDVDPQLLDARVPSLILQPLVENAVRHGVAARTAAGRIEVAASREDEMLLVTVRDDGPGMADDAQEGIGLSNTRSRLELLYGKRHSFRLDRAEGGGLQIALAIPLQAAAAAT
jgi:two-component system LytT family sensor kinase